MGALMVKRWVVLGTGTGIGKTFVARALVELLARGGEAVAGLKPIETGLSPGAASSDAASLAAVSFHVKLPSPHPLYAFADPVTPALAARRASTNIQLRAIPEWAARVEPTTGNTLQLVIETAGGVFSPISDQTTNLDLALALGPATWILVAPDRLGVLHDIQSCLLAMRALGRWPDWLILSAPELPDSSTGTNAAELTRHPTPPIISLPRHDALPLERLLTPPVEP
jgi:dethiobiotin synthetase